MIEFIEEQTPLLPLDDELTCSRPWVFSAFCSVPYFHVQSSGKKEVTGANVLVAIFSEKQSQAVYFLNMQDITGSMSSISFRTACRRSVPSDGETEDADRWRRQLKPEESPLEKYATNLNQLAIEGKIDPLIGREMEIERTVQILCRRRKNNPLYVGEAGVGKTALAEGLAR